MRESKLITFLIRPRGLFLTGSALLALDPLLWLLRGAHQTMFDPFALLSALSLLMLAAWSYTSEQLPGSETNHRHAWTLLVISAGLRLLAQISRLHLMGALSLTLDVYALATLAGLHQRRRRVTPLWAALLFAFTLPLERVMQRLAAYSMQQFAGLPQGSMQFAAYALAGVAILLWVGSAQSWRADAGALSSAYCQARRRRSLGTYLFSVLAVGGAGLNLYADLRAAPVDATQKIQSEAAPQSGHSPHRAPYLAC